MPVLADNAVATSQPLAAQAGLRTLARGGNAVDAAIAAAAALTVVEPVSNGIGGDLFALVWRNGTLSGLNASGRSPALLDVDAVRRAGAMPKVGWWPVTTPGAVSGWAALSQRFGTLSLAEALAPAVRYARDGFLVSPQVAVAWARAAERFAGFSAFRDTFLPRMRAPQAGERFRSAAHAATLESIGASSGASFYTGPLAAAIDAASRAEGGFLRAEDLAAHQPQWVTPLSVPFRSRWRLHELPPNGQGIAALIAIGVLDRLPLRHHEPDSGPHIHLQIEAMKLGFADAHRHVSDPEHAEIDVRELLSPSYLDSRAALVDPDRAQDFGHGTPRPGGTVLVTAADASGMMVTLIQSNYMGFGSGAVVRGTGIALQNRGCGFSLQPGHPNEIAGGKRPYHTIIPGFLTCDGAPVAALGVMGGPMQPQGHLQVVVRLVDQDDNPQAALDAPRWRIESGCDISLEEGFSQESIAWLREAGHTVRAGAARSVHFGGGQVIWRLEDGGYVAGSDLRRDGQAVGF
jgi:gamma-glutamyltranspeptidase/glutathione hydrolase